MPSVIAASAIDVKELSPEQLVDALDDPELETEVQAEIDSRLRRNKVNWHFYRLIDAWQLHNDRLVADAYKNLRRMAMRYLNNLHTPEFTVTWEPDNGGEDISPCRPPASYWDDVFHQTLFGDTKRKGEVQRYLHLSQRKNLINALHNRYSGVLTRCGQRHKNLWKKRQFEHSTQPSEDAGDSDDAVVEVVYESGPAAQPMDVITRDEITADPRWGDVETTGQPNLVAEHRLLGPVAIEEFTKKNAENIEREAGESGKRTWVIIAEALAGGELDLSNLTEAETSKDILDLLMRTEGIKRPAAWKRLRKLRKSTTVKRFLVDQISWGEQVLGDSPCQIRVGRSGRRKQLSGNRRARRRTGATATAE